jgi:hypothetical protein
MKTILTNVKTVIFLQAVSWKCEKHRFSRQLFTIRYEIFLIDFFQLKMMIKFLIIELKDETK